MHFSRRILTVTVAVIAMVVSASPVMARGYSDATSMLAPDTHSYSGSWPVVVTHSQHSNGTYCLTLTQNGRNGGSASLVITLVATIQAEGYGQNAGLVFIGSASRGNIGRVYSTTSTAVKRSTKVP